MEKNDPMIELRLKQDEIVKIIKDCLKEYSLTPKAKKKLVKWFTKSLKARLKVEAKVFEVKDAY